jgi:hypothetical protein
MSEHGPVTKWRVSRFSLIDVSRPHECSSLSKDATRTQPHPVHKGMVNGPLPCIIETHSPPKILVQRPGEMASQRALLSLLQPEVSLDFSPPSTCGPPSTAFYSLPEERDLYNVA